MLLSLETSNYVNCTGLVQIHGIEFLSRLFLSKLNQTLDIARFPELFKSELFIHSQHRANLSNRCLLLF